MAAGGGQQPAVIQGGNLPWHDCVLNVHWFMISKGDGAIDDRVTYGRRKLVYLQRRVLTYTHTFLPAD